MHIRNNLLILQLENNEYSTIDMNVLELSEQEVVRRQSLQQLRDMGIEPYPAAEYPTNAFSTDIKSNFNENDKREVCIAGRLMSRRVMGKASFSALKRVKSACMRVRSSFSARALNHCQSLNIRTELPTTSSMTRSFGHANAM